jgi:hypothetical protein
MDHWIQFVFIVLLGWVFLVEKHMEHGPLVWIQICLWIRLSVRLSIWPCPSNKADVRLISLIIVNTMLTFDRVKPKLLYPQWLRHGCHVTATMASSCFKSWHTNLRRVCMDRRKHVQTQEGHAYIQDCAHGYRMHTQVGRCVWVDVHR